MRLLRMFLVGALALGGLPTASHATDLLVPPAAPAAPEEADRLNVIIAPYVWGAGLTGTVGVGGLPPVQVDQSFGDILSQLNIAAFVTAELEYRRFIGLTDLQYVNLASSQSTPFGVVADRVKLHTEQLSWIFAGGYRFVEEENLRLEALAGVRLWHVSNRVNLSGSPINRDFDVTQTWVDPIVGLKGAVDVTPSISLIGWGFVGGFGVASDFTWDVLGGVGWSPRENVSLYVGYRAEGVDYTNDDFEFDVIQHGPLIGAAIRF